MPRLWTETIEAHRREVHAAIVETTARLVDEQGLLSVTMSRIAEETGIGRATLYKYFPSVESILRAWHRREVSRHFEHLKAVQERAGHPMERLAHVLEAYAFISREAKGHRDAELAAFLHRDEQVSNAERRLRAMIRGLLIQGVKAGQVRDDIAPEELATYCVSALTAARTVPSKAAVRRVVKVTIDGLRA
jgi:AcrR family transcriptional regulator